MLELDLLPVVQKCVLLQDWVDCSDPHLPHQAVLRAVVAVFQGGCGVQQGGGALALHMSVCGCRRNQPWRFIIERLDGECDC